MADGDMVRELYEGCYRRLVGQLFAICGDLGEAEDAVQEAFVKALGHRSFARLGNPEAWLRTVALNHLRNRWRHNEVGEVRAWQASGRPRRCTCRRQGRDAHREADR